MLWLLRPSWLLEMQLERSVAGVRAPVALRLSATPSRISSVPAGLKERESALPLSRTSSEKETLLTGICCSIKPNTRCAGKTLAPSVTTLLWEVPRALGRGSVHTLARAFSLSFPFTCDQRRQRVLNHWRFPSAMLLPVPLPALSREFSCSFMSFPVPHTEHTDVAMNHLPQQLAPSWCTKPQDTWMAGAGFDIGADSDDAGPFRWFIDERSLSAPGTVFLAVNFGTYVALLYTRGSLNVMGFFTPPASHTNCKKRRLYQFHQVSTLLVRRMYAPCSSQVRFFSLRSRPGVVATPPTPPLLLELPAVAKVAPPTRINGRAWLGRSCLSCPSAR